MADVIELLTYSQRLELDDSGFTSGMKNAEKKFGGFGNSLGSIGAGIGKTIGVGLVASTAALTGFATEGVKLASDLSEVQNVVDTTFGSNSTQIDTWAKNAATSFGMSELSAKKYNGTMGAMLKSMGLSNDKVLDMSTSITGLAGDFASFYNLDSQDAFDKIRAGISGETEPLKQLGINMSVANLQAFAMSQGIDKSFNSMTQAEQATLRYNYLMATTADAQGDFSKTSDSMANQMRIAELKIQDLSSSFGTMLLPIVNNSLSSILSFVNESMPAFNDLFTGFTGLLTGAEGAEQQFANGASVIVDKIVNTLSLIIPKAVQVLANLLPAVATSIMTNLPVLISEVMKILPDISQTLLSMLPMILDSGIKIVLSIIEGIANALPQLIPQIVNTVVTMATTLIDNISLIVDAGIKLIMGLALGLVNALPQLIEKIPVIIEKLINSLIENLPKLIEMGIQLTVQLGVGLIKAIPELIKSIPKIFIAIVKAFAEIDWLDIGVNILKGIAEGLIQGVMAISDTIKSVSQSVIDGFKGFFGIHSPSTVFAELGGFMSEGLGEGFVDEMKNVTKDMQNSIPTAEIATIPTAEIATTGLLTQNQSVNKSAALNNKSVDTASSNDNSIIVNYTAGNISVNVDGLPDNITVEKIQDIANKATADGIDFFCNSLADRLAAKTVQQQYKR